MYIWIGTIPLPPPIDPATQITESQSGRVLEGTSGDHLVHPPCQILGHGLPGC